MVRIKWRRGRSLWVVTGLSRYTSQEAAQQQINLWKFYFPNNRYYIEQEGQ